MYPEDEYILISSLQHYMFCPRQCALIYVDQYWSENYLTVAGRLMHERVHEPDTRYNTGCRIEYSVPLCNRRLGITGIADMVEYRKGSDGLLVPCAVEYKHGKPKENRCDEVQLCAEMLCLEEMMGCSIQSSAIYYGRTHRRIDIALDDELRSLTERVIGEVHALISSGTIPPPDYKGHACNSCSLLDYCCPLDSMRVEEYLETIG